MEKQHIAILGAGPVGLEMALAATDAGFRVTVLERGPTVAANVRIWGHVTLFSNNKLNVSELGMKTLQSNYNKSIAMDQFYTGEQLCNEYLDPIASYLSEQCDDATIRCGVNVISIGRGRLLKGQSIGAPDRAQTSFRLLLQTEAGGEELLDGFDFVIDATGSYGNHNWTGKGGVPAVGERSLAANGGICYTIPDLADAAAAGASYLSKVTAVIGSGASAITTLKGLQKLSQHGEVHVVWITRRAAPPYSIIENDPLPQRAELYILGNALASGETTEGYSSFQYKGCSDVIMTDQAIKPGGDGGYHLTLERRTQEGAVEVETIHVDNVIANVGYRPDTTLSEELQVHYCYATQGPMKLAAAMMAAGGGGGDCLAQVAPGAQTMINPEPGFFVIGMKSYGRGSAFLMKIGQEQVQQVMELLGAAKSNL